MREAPATHRMSRREAELMAGITIAPKDGDHCSEAGAWRLAKRIEEYWAERGYTVEVKVETGDFSSTLRQCITSVRSDMLNGWPAAAVLS